MKKFFIYLIENIYEGTITGAIIMIILSFALMLGLFTVMKTISDHNGRVCNYSGKFWIDDSKDRNREGDLKGCFSWEEMIEMERL